MLPLPRLRFAHLPTPVEPLPRLTQALGGPRLWVKRDDQTGLALGGNKTRKLEFLLAKAQADGARTVLTVGAPQSNHCRQTAAAAARFGLDCRLVLNGHRSTAVSGNILLDRLLGAEIIWAEGRDPDQALDEAFEQAWDQGKRPYKIPAGGSNALGAAGYVEAMREFLEQGVEVDRIIVAASTCGTYAGLLAGAALGGFPGRITAISVGPPRAQLEARTAELLDELARLLPTSVRAEAAAIEVLDDYVGGGYAVIGDPEREAIRLFASREGLLLDPVYTGRAAAGMIDLVRRGEVRPDERVLFWHTGGLPALFAHGEDIL